MKIEKTLLLIALVLLVKLVYSVAPTVTDLLYPNISDNVTTNYVNFNFSVTDDTPEDGNVTNCSIYVNATGTWQEVALVIINNASITTNTTVFIDDGFYKWNALCRDNESFESWYTSNITFTIDASGPNITIINPTNNTGTYNKSYTFDFTTEDLRNVKNCSLVFNNEINITNTSIDKSINQKLQTNLTPGQYNWSIQCHDGDLLGVNGTYNLTILAQVYWNESTLNLGKTRLNGTVLNGSRNIIVNNTNTDITIDCVGNCSEINTNWTTASYDSHQIHTVKFNCSPDTFGVNIANFSLYSDYDLEPDNITVTCNVTAPDLRISSFQTNETNPVENDVILLNATIVNSGNANVTNVIVQFFEGNWANGVQIGTNQTINISEYSNKTVNQSYTMGTGGFEFSVIVDANITYGGQYPETNENNNDASLFLNVGSWQTYSGNLSGDLVLATSSGDRIFKWNISNSTDSNIYVVDTDSIINWDELGALGRDTFDVYQQSDFLEADNVLHLENNTDSINITYLESGNPILTQAISVYSYTINNVPYANSTDNDNFTTGILWDKSDDSNNQFDEIEKEDIVFVTQSNPQKGGKYGVYDFEIRVPSRLREYKGGTDTVDFYVELK